MSQLEGLWQNVHIQAVQKAYLQLELSGVPLPSGTSKSLSSLCPVWINYLDPLNICLHGKVTCNVVFYLE